MGSHHPAVRLNHPTSPVTGGSPGRTGDPSLEPVRSGPSWWAVGVALLILAAVVVDIRLTGPLDHLDHRIGARANNWDLRHRTVARRALTVGLYFGQRGVVLPLSVALAGWQTWRARTAEPILRLIVAAVSLAVVVYAFKLGLARNAPIQDAHGVAAGQGASFPSGHMANAILLWGLANWSVRRWLSPARLRFAVRIGRWIAPIAIFVCMTLLNYHWLSDFIGGAAVGVILLALALWPQWAVAAEWLDTRVGPANRSGST